HTEGYALPQNPDAGGTVTCATLLRSRPRHRGRLLRLLPRSDRCRPERDRAPPDPRVHLPRRWYVAAAHITPTPRAMRPPLSHGLHPATTARLELRRHSLPQLPRPLERA